MCDPVSIAVGTIGAGLSATGAAMSYGAQKKAAGQQETYNNQQQLENAKFKYENAVATQKSYLEQTHQINLGLQQQSESDAYALQQSDIANLLNAATVQEQAVEGNVGGNTLTMLLQGFDRAQAMSEFYASRQDHIRRNMTAEQLKAIQANAQNSINSVKDFVPQSVNKPSLGGSIVGGVQGMLGGFGQGWKLVQDIRNA